MSLAVVLIIALPIAVVAMTNWLALDPIPAPEPVPPSPSLNGVGELHSVIVGVADYENDSMDIPGPDNGARAMADIVAVLWGEDAHVRLLTNEDATKANIRQAIASMASEADEEDFVLFYFTGHGDKEYILPYDTLPASYSNSISAAILDGWLDDLRSDKVIVVIDSCMSGGFARGLACSGRMVLTSCAANEYASTELSYYIGLGFGNPDQLDLDGNRLISIEEIYAHVRSQRISGQHPQLADGYAGELVLLSLRAQ
ncbi:MAG: caspase family protein [Dehalococcoidia bacterium]|nr:caspase family protein [Dehalococcoidia bacterium]